MGAALALEAPDGWDFACPDWWQRLQEGRSLVPELPLDQAEAGRAVKIFDRLRLPDVPGQPTNAEAAGDWFRDIVRAAFGSVDRSAGVRRVPEIFCLVPKKNNKTTGGAHVILTGLLMNRRPNVELQFVGPTQEIADKAFQQAANSIAIDPDGYLQKRYLVRDHLKTIKDRLTGAWVKIKTFDAKVATGSGPMIVLLDELHLMATMSKAAEVLRQIRGGMISNPESLLIMITTQSDSPPAGVFRAELDYARDVRDGRVGPGARVLPILYEFPEAMQTAPDKPWAEPANWHLVNPNLGRSIALERLRSDWEAERHKGEAQARSWASQHLNVEIGLALHANRWRGADYWEAAADPDLVDLEALLERSEVATVGIDGGGVDDLLGLTVIGREKDTGRWLCWSHAWADQDNLSEQRKQIMPRLQDFANDGDLSFWQGGTADIEALARIVGDIGRRGLLPERYGVGLDPAGVAAIVDALAAEGIETHDNDGPACGVPQSYRLTGTIQALERKLKDGSLAHAPQRLMNWCVGNAKAELKGNAIHITKEAAGRGKIDPLSALFDAAFLMQRKPVAGMGYVEGGLIVA